MKIWLNIIKFLLQPNIYTLDANLLSTTERKAIDSSEKYIDVNLRKLTELVYKKINNRNELRSLNFYDISDSLNHSPKDDYYLDNCHLFSNGNKIVAARILAILSNYLPNRYIK